ncbi:MAG TPA: ketoacyl-ACP synthase III [Candidatus Saccharimonadaceae bacterium]|nr:ketoacyl-ACP synthase III [Candidatus Saccharimonadaceae bacterium]
MRIRSVAHALPSRVVTNDDLIARILCETNGSIGGERRPAFETALRGYFERTGAVTRHHRADGERALDFGILAGRRALERAGLDPGDVDLLIYVGVGRGFLEPATANVFQSALGLTSATCFDILDACASWVRALDVARHMIHGGGARRVLLLNCEFNFEEYIRWDFQSADDLEHLGAGFTVGEAATAAVLEAGDEPDEFYRVFRTRGELHGLCQIPLPNAAQYLPEAGANGHRPLSFFAHATDLNNAAIADLEQLYWSDPCISRMPHDVIVGHSTSVPAARSVVKRLKLDTGRLVETFTRHGNTVSASLPLALSLAVDSGRLERGHRVLMVMASAGVTTGFCRLRW